MSCCIEVQAYKDLNGVLHKDKSACENRNKEIKYTRDREILKTAMYSELDWFFNETLEDRHTFRPNRGSMERRAIEFFLDDLVHRGYDIIKVRDYG